MFPIHEVLSYLLEYTTRCGDSTFMMPDARLGSFFTLLCFVPSSLGNCRNSGMMLVVVVVCSAFRTKCSKIYERTYFVKLNCTYVRAARALEKCAGRMELQCNMSEQHQCCSSSSSRNCSDIIKVTKSYSWSFTHSRITVLMEMRILLQHGGRRSA